MTMRDDLVTAALDEMGSFFGRDDAARVVERFMARLENMSPEMVDAAVKQTIGADGRDYGRDCLCPQCCDARTKARAAWAAALRAV